MEKFDLAYFMISVDTPEDNKKFAESLESGFPLLSNPSKEVAEAYGVVTADRPFPFRWTFIIGGDGKILKVDRKVKSAVDGETAVKTLKELGIEAAR